MTRPLFTRVLPLFLAIIAAVPAVASDRSVTFETLKTRAMEMIGLHDCRLVTIELPESAGQLAAVDIEIDGVVRTIDLHRHSVRAADFKLHEPRPDGTLREIEPGPARTFRGTVRDEPGSRVAASLFAGGLWATIDLDASRFWIEPLNGRVEDAGPDLHAVYRSVEAIDPGLTCGVPSFGAAATNWPRDDGDAAALAGGTVCSARLACEADYYFFLDWGASTLNRIETVINTLNMQYEEEVGITHVLGDVIINSAIDPYPPPGTVSAGDMLCWFSVWWTNFRQNIQRDLAHMFTGRPLTGSLAGFATVSSVCQVNGCFSIPCVCGNTSGIGGAYSVVESDIGSNAFSIALSSHHLGHNWGALHCDNLGCCPGGTMCSTIGTSANFSAAARYLLLVGKGDAPCLDCDTGCVGTPTSTTLLAADRQDGDRAGAAVANAGDVDNDGCDDYIVGASSADGNRGKVYVYSGADDSLLYLIPGANLGDRFGWSVSGIGDANLDTFDDFIVGAPFFQNQRGRVYVYSGFDGSVLFTRTGKNNQRDRFGYAVTGGVDVNNDGHDDFIVGEPHNDDEGNKAGRVRVYSGDNGATLKTLRGENRGDRFGWAVAGIGRSNSDNFDDFIVGAPRNDDEASNAGKVYVYSGKTFGFIFTIAGLEGGDQFGRALAAGGDLDYDGRDDFIVGSPYYDKGSKKNAGRVDVFSGFNGLTLWSRNGPAENDRMGWSVGSSDDIDGDMLSDVIIGVPRSDAVGADSGRVYIRSGYSGCSIARIDGAAAGDQLGFSVAMIPGGCGAEAAALLGAPNHDDAMTNEGSVLKVSIDVVPGPAAPEEANFARSGDLDGDGVVTGSDLALLLGRWGACWPCPEDLNRDGHVDTDDLLTLFAQW